MCILARPFIPKLQRSFDRTDPDKISEEIISKFVNKLLGNLLCILS
jgi:hypothetical protein